LEIDQVVKEDVVRRPVRRRLAFSCADAGKHPWNSS
jgi:hypothetical protein